MKFPAVSNGIKTKKKLNKIQYAFKIFILNSFYKFKNKKKNQHKNCKLLNHLNDSTENLMELKNPTSIKGEQSTWIMVTSTERLTSKVSQADIEYFYGFFQPSEDLVNVSLDMHSTSLHKWQSGEGCQQASSSLTLKLTFRTKLEATVFDR